MRTRVPQRCSLTGSQICLFVCWRIIRIRIKQRQQQDSDRTVHGKELPARLAARVTTSIPWVKRFTPGHPLSHVQVGDMVLKSRIHMDAREGDAEVKKPQRFAMYMLNPEARGKMKKPYQQQTRSKDFTRGNAKSEHMAFQTVLQWIWAKHTALSPGTVKPDWLAAELTPCAHCSKDLPCEAMARHWASKDSPPVPLRVRMDTESTPAAAVDSAMETAISPQHQTPTPAMMQETVHGSAAEMETSNADVVQHQCEVCLHWTTHAAKDCPLVLQASSARASWCSRPPDLPRVHLNHAELLRVPGDGNCMFSAYALGCTTHLGNVPTGDSLKSYGIRVRQHFLTRIKKFFRGKITPNASKASQFTTFCWMWTADQTTVHGVFQRSIGQRRKSISSGWKHGGQEHHGEGQPSCECLRA